MALPIVAVEGVEYQSGLVSVEGNPELEVDIQTKIRRVDVGELVDAAYQPGRGLLGVFSFNGDPAKVRINVTRHPGYPLRPAIVEQAELRTKVAAEGVAVTWARYRLRTKALYLQIQLPPQAELWASDLDGQPIKPQGEKAGAAIHGPVSPGGHAGMPAREEKSVPSPQPSPGGRGGRTLLVSLPAATVGQTRTLQLVYQEPIRPLAMTGRVRIAAPKLSFRADRGQMPVEVPVADFQWSMRLPTGYQVTRSDGTVTTTLDRPEPAVVSLAKGVGEFCLACPMLLMPGGCSVKEAARPPDTAKTEMMTESPKSEAAKEEAKPAEAPPPAASTSAASPYPPAPTAAPAPAPQGGPGSPSRPYAVFGSTSVPGSAQPPTHNATVPQAAGFLGQSPPVGLSSAGTQVSPQTFDGVAKKKYEAANADQPYAGKPASTPPMATTAPSATTGSWNMPQAGGQQQSGQQPPVAPVPTTPGSAGAYGPPTTAAPPPASYGLAVPQYGGTVVPGPQQPTVIVPAMLGPPKVPPPAPKPVFGRRLEGLSSLKIDYQEEPQGVVGVVAFQSLGADPEVDVRVADRSRWSLLGWAVALAVALAGVSLTRRGAAAKVKFVVLVILVATVLPLIPGLEDLVGPCNMAVYAAAILVPYYLLAGILRGLVKLLLRRRREKAALVAGAAAVLLAIFVAIPPGMAGEPQDGQPVGQSGPAWPPGLTGQPATVVLTAPLPPVKVPDDAILVPYDPKAAHGVDDASRLLVPYDKYVELWNRAYPDKKLEVVPPPASYALAGVSYTTTLGGDDSLAVEGRMTINVFSDQYVSIPLGLDGGVLSRAQLDGKPARLSVTAPVPPNLPQAANARQGADDPFSQQAAGVNGQSANPCAGRLAAGGHSHAADVVVAGLGQGPARARDLGPHEARAPRRVAGGRGHVALGAGQRFDRHRARERDRGPPGPRAGPAQL